MVSALIATTLSIELSLVTEILRNQSIYSKREKGRKEKEQRKEERKCWSDRTCLLGSSHSCAFIKAVVDYLTVLQISVCYVTTSRNLKDLASFVRCLCHMGGLETFSFG